MSVRLFMHSKDARARKEAVMWWWKTLEVEWMRTD